MKIFKYIFEFISVISLFFIFKILGLKNASNVGGILGRLIGPFFRSKEIVKKNIKIGLGVIDEKKEREIINSMWSNIGRTFAEYIFLKDFRQNKTNFEHIKINGIQYLEQIKKSNEPVVFYSGHFANFELMAMELDKFGIKTAAIYRPLNNFLLNPIMEFFRMKYICPNQIPKGRIGMREIINRIKNGYSIALMVDQRVSEGRRLPFFKQGALTTTLPAQLALRYKCDIIPIYISRNSDSSFKMEIYDPIKTSEKNSSEKNKIDISLKINKIIEEMILKNPGQWIWTHNRWK